MECAAAFENGLAGNRDKGEQADVYLGLKKPFEKVHHRRLKRNASSHQIRRKDTIDIVGLINLKKNPLKRNKRALGKPKCSKNAAVGQNFPRTENHFMLVIVKEGGQE